MNDGPRFTHNDKGVILEITRKNYNKLYDKAISDGHLLLTISDGSASASSYGTIPAEDIEAKVNSPWIIRCFRYKSEIFWQPNPTFGDGLIRNYTIWAILWNPVTQEFFDYDISEY